MKYVVVNEFLDRFDGMRHCKPSEVHVPPNEERAKQLVELGFIKLAEDEAIVKQSKSKPRSKSKPKKDESEQLNEDVKGGDTIVGEVDESEEV